MEGGADYLLFRSMREASPPYHTDERRARTGTIQEFVQEMSFRIHCKVSPHALVAFKQHVGHNQDNSLMLQADSEECATCNLLQAMCSGFHLFSETIMCGVGG